MFEGGRGQHHYKTNEEIHWIFNAHTGRKKIVQKASFIEYIYIVLNVYTSKDLKAPPISDWEIVQNI